MKTRKLLMCAFLGALLLTPAWAEVELANFWGTWKINHDGWEGTLYLHAAGSAPAEIQWGQTPGPGNLSGTYVEENGRAHKVSGHAETLKQYITFKVDFDDSGSYDPSELGFTGYLFSKDRKAMAGTTIWNNGSVGWYALKTSGRTEPTQTVKTDTVTPKTDKDTWQEEEVKPVTPADKGELLLYTTAKGYGKKETVAFEMRNTTKQMISLNGSYYLIESKQNQTIKEFFTSVQNPFGTNKIQPGEKIRWTWNQWDNERKHNAAAGTWRIRVYIPSLDLGEKWLVAYFRLQ